MQDAPYRLIPLRNRTGDVVAHAKIDAADLKWLDQWRWSLTATSGYVTRGEWQAGRIRQVKMHRQILGLERGDPREGDHINRDRLDHRRVNLRILTKAQNAQNTSAHRGSSSCFRGVSWDRRHGRWVAYAKLHHKQYWLGYHDDELVAARVAATFRAAHMPFSQEAG